MRVLRAVSAAILAAAMTGVPAGAQQLTRVDGPKEPPPAGFTGNQYVDSAGCVFIRAGVGGQTAWVPRVSRDRKPVCGYAPTFPPGTREAAAPVAPPAPAAIPDASEPARATEAVAAPAKAPAPVATPAPAARPAAAAAPAAATVRRKAARPAPAGPVRLVRNGPVAPAATLCLERIDAAQRYLLSDGRRVTQCAETGPQEPVAYLNGLGAPGLAVAPGAPSDADTRRATKAGEGAFRVVWQNGRIAGTDTAPSAATPAAPGGYVQVGVFADPANAGAAIARLGALGLPVASSTGRIGGRPVKSIMAGPFASHDDLRSALAAARQAGYPDAYIRG